MKKVFTILLALCLLISLAPNVFAEETTPQNLPPVKKFSEEQYQKDDILPLEKYVSVKDGYLVLDSEKAKSDGFKDDLINGQQKYFDFLNSEISAGNLHVEKNLNIVGSIEDQSNIKSSDADILACKGKTTKVKYYWWGYSRKMNSCLTSQVATDLASAGSVASGIAVITAIWGVIPSLPPGIAASYWGLISARLNANDKGKGVIADVTWALVFNIKPQK